MSPSIEYSCAYAVVKPRSLGFRSEKRRIPMFALREPQNQHPLPGRKLAQQYPKGICVFCIWDTPTGYLIGTCVYIYTYTYTEANYALCNACLYTVSPIYASCPHALVAEPDMNVKRAKRPCWAPEPTTVLLFRGFFQVTVKWVYSKYWGFLTTVT